MTLETKVLAAIMETIDHIVKNGDTSIGFYNLSAIVNTRGLSFANANHRMRTIETAVQNLSPTYQARIDDSPRKEVL